MCKDQSMNIVLRIQVRFGKEIYSNVPSHYDSYKNMYSSLRSNAERLAYRSRVLGRAKKISGTLQLYKSNVI